MSSRLSRDANAAEDRNSVSLQPGEFASLFEESSRLLWCVAASVVNDRVLADDVLQEAAVIALRKLDEFQIGTSYNAWMSRIVRFVALNHARRRSRNVASLTDPAVLHDVASGSQRHEQPRLTGRGELAADQELFDDRVLAALDTLDETARACLLLRTILDMPYREIALALEIPEGTAMSHVHRARKALRAQLADFDTQAETQSTRSVL